MTKQQFESEVRRLERRLQLIRDAARGSVKLRTVHVPATRVRAHTRREHVRYIAPRGWRGVSR